LDANDKAQTTTAAPKQALVGAWLIVGLVMAASVLCFAVTAYVFLARGG
jgi:hypothetical protein